MIDRELFAATLPPGEASIFYVLHANRDVKITTLFGRIEASNHKLPYHKKQSEIMRYKQQRVGAYVCRLNARLAPKGWMITPGNARRTYRLRRIHGR